MNENDASTKKLQASRSNGRKSRGPITERGKNYSSRNALTHGLLSKDVVITDGQGEEDAEQYQNVLTAHIEDLQPVGIHEEMLVKEIVDCRWRLRRAKRAEVGEVRKNVDDISHKHAQKRIEQFVVGSEQNSFGARKELDALHALRSQVEAGHVSADAMELLEEIDKESPELAASMAIFRNHIKNTDESEIRSGQAIPGLKDARRRLLNVIDAKVMIAETLVRIHEGREEWRLSAEKSADLVPQPYVLDRLLRYEAAINRQLYKAIHELERSKMRRSGQQVPVAGQLDIS